MAMITAITLELVQEILLRLPAASIVRLRCVCKEWRDLTSDSSFVEAYTRRSPRRASGVLLYCNGPWSIRYSTSCSTLDGSRVFPEPWGSDRRPLVFHGEILQSCNGLLVGQSTEERGGPDRSALWVYNPTTLQRRILPNCTWDCYRRRCRGVVLAFDPWQSLSYSIVLLCYHPDEIIAYRSKTDSWHTIFSKEPWISSLSSANCCFCNGVVCWFTRDGFLISMDVEQCSIRKTTQTCLPDVDQNYSISYCGESRGRLRLIRSNVPVSMPASLSMKPLDPSAVLEVLELASDNSTWILLHKIHIRDMYREICGMRWGSSVTSGTFKASMCLGIALSCCLVEAGEGEDDEIVLVLENKIVAYDLGSRTLRVLRTDDKRQVAKQTPCRSTIAAP